MATIWGCVSQQHDLRLVALAILVGLLSSCCAIRVWWSVRDADARGKRARLLLAGGAAGFGIWATHFLAMEAYAPGLPIGFDLPHVLASLVIPVVFTAAGLSLADTDRGGSSSSIAAGLVVSLSIVAMHYLGAQSLAVPGRIGWEPRLVLLSIAIGVVAATTALWVASRWRNACSLALSGGLFATAIAGLHFTAMAAMKIMPDPRLGNGVAQLSSDGLGWMICAIGVMLVSAGIAINSGRRPIAVARPGLPAAPRAVPPAN